jgi:Exopolysaccharide biosynthesis protein
MISLASNIGSETSGRPYHDFVSFIGHLAREGRSIFFDPCQGNNGDDLIIIGAESVFSAVGIRVVDTPHAADVIVINGGGMFVEGFIQGVTKVREYSEIFPDKPLCIGPQSFHLSSNTLRGAVLRRLAPLIVCVRETPSQENLDKILSDLPRVEFLRDHDLAFQIPTTHPIFTRPRTEQHILIVERLDGEHHSQAGRSLRHRRQPWHRRLAYWVLPTSTKQLLRKRRQEAKSERITPYRLWVEKTISADFPQLAGLPRLARDLSSREVASFEDFVNSVAASALVFTDRLHVGILAARMGKRTFLFEGSYHKCRGVYERSLAGFPNVTLVPPSVLKEQPAPVVSA